MRGDYNQEERAGLYLAALTLGLLNSFTVLCYVIITLIHFLPTILPKQRHVEYLVQLVDQSMSITANDGMMDMHGGKRDQV